jgi:hypothetical protein
LSVFIEQPPPWILIEVLDQVEKGHIWTLFIWGLQRLHHKILLSLSVQLVPNLDTIFSNSWHQERLF